MNSRNWFTLIAMPSVLTVGLWADAASAAGVSFLERGASARNNAIEIKGRGRDPQIVLPIAPSYLAYDYPYYYRRGHYPTRIGGPGYVYYGYPYSYSSSSRYGRCAYWPSKSVRRAWIDARRCVGN